MKSRLGPVVGELTLMIRLPKNNWNSHVLGQRSTANEGRRLSPMTNVSARTLQRMKLRNNHIN